MLALMWAGLGGKGGGDGEVRTGSRHGRDHHGLHGVANNIMLLLPLVDCVKRQYLGDFATRMRTRNGRRLHGGPV